VITWENFHKLFRLYYLPLRERARAPACAADLVPTEPEWQRAPLPVSCTPELVRQSTHSRSPRQARRGLGGLQRGLRSWPAPPRIGSARALLPAGPRASESRARRGLYVNNKACTHARKHTRTITCADIARIMFASEENIEMTPRHGQNAARGELREDLELGRSLPAPLHAPCPCSYQNRRTVRTDAEYLNIFQIYATPPRHVHVNFLMSVTDQT
jgi:hypothetical protein